MRTFIMGAALLALLCTAGPAAAKEKPDERRAKVTDAERDTAIRKGRAYLADTVLQLTDAQGTPTKQFTVAVTGLVELLAADGGSSSSREGTDLRRIRSFLAEYVAQVAEDVQDRDRLPDGPGQFRSDRLIQYVWPVAMTGVFFGELHARGKHKAEARRVLKDVRQILRAAQHESGGWGHHQLSGNQAAARSGLGGYPDTLLCTTFVAASALALLEGKPGKDLPKHLGQAADYLRTAQLDNGNFPYDPSQRSAHRSLNGVSRTAGSAFALWTLGMPLRHETMQRSLDFIDEHFDYLNEGHGSSTLNLLYGALLQHVRGKRAWKRFRARYFRPIVDAQAEDGSFACICEGKAFGATNDTDPLAGKGNGKGMASAMKQAGDPRLLEKLRGGTKTAYVSAIHVLILLLDRTRPELLEGKRPRIPSAPSAPVTTR